MNINISRCKPKNVNEYIYIYMYIYFLIFLLVKSSEPTLSEPMILPWGAGIVCPVWGSSETLR